MLKTKIWSDDWFSELSVDAKLLYIYLLSNLNTHICGYYKLSLKVMEFNTGLTQKKILTALEKLTENVQYIDGWVVLKNYPKYQNVANNMKVQAAIERELAQIPPHVLNPNLNHKSKSEAMDSLSIPSKKEKKVDKAVENEKKAYGELKNVKLTDDEKTKLKEKYGVAEIKTLVEELSVYIPNKAGAPYKDHYATLLAWARKKGLAVIQSKEPKMIPETQDNGTVRLVPNPKYHG